MNDIQAYIVNLAVVTGKVLLEYFDPAGIQAVPKADLSVVTEADLAADRFITQKLRKDFPGNGIVSEESAHFYDDKTSATWVIDPLDGTTNFSLGIPVWGISIARLINGFPETGVVYFPLLNELYTSSRGSGARLNKQPINAHAPDPAKPMSFFSCCSRTFRTFNVSVPYKPRIMGSTAYSFCMVARGAALMAFDVVPKIWDLAAAWLLVEEAGGIILPFEAGQIFPLSSGLDYNTTSRPVLAAANVKMYEMGKKKITRKST